MAIILPDTFLFSLSIELPESTHRAAVHVAFETGHIGSIDDHLAADGAWEDIPMDLSAVKNGFSDPTKAQEGRDRPRKEIDVKGKLSARAVMKERRLRQLSLQERR